MRKESSNATWRAHEFVASFASMCVSIARIRQFVAAIEVFAGDGQYMLVEGIGAKASLA